MFLIKDLHVKLYVLYTQISGIFFESLQYFVKILRLQNKSFHKSMVFPDINIMIAKVE